LVDELPAVFADALPMPGEEAYAVLAVLALKQVMTEAVEEADRELVAPLFEFRNYGEQLPDHRSMISNEAAFRSDYFTRTAVAKSNILVNSPNETKYFYQDLAAGARLNGAKRYTVTFAKGQIPPVNGFWSLTLYNQHHFFAPNKLNRYLLGTKSKSMKPNPDSSLTIYIQAGNRGSDEEANWLPGPKDENFSLYARTYWPKVQVTDGSRAPPPVNKVERLSYGRRGTSPRPAVSSYELADLGSLGGQQHARPASSQGKVKPQALFGNRRCSMRTSRFSFRDSNDDRACVRVDGALGTQPRDIHRNRKIVLKHRFRRYHEGGRASPLHGQTQLSPKIIRLIPSGKGSPVAVRAEAGWVGG
jgi:hypothetical protein